MRSVTSCFNPTLYHKTMGRFWPLWALYGLGWLFAMPLNLLNNYSHYSRLWQSTPDRVQTAVLDAATSIPGMLVAGAFLSCVFGVLCAMAVFGYLYNNRSACMIHALPMKREALFTTQYLAGLSFLLLPHLAVAALTAAVEIVLLPSMYWAPALSSLGLWLVVQSATALFFFSFASFCAMFTGHILALPAFYGILNGLVMAVYTLIRELMAQFFYGLPGGYTNSDFVEFCTPLLTLMEACEMEPGQYTSGGITSTTDEWFLQAPNIVAIYAAVGLVLAVLALMVYQRRHVESAGDVVAIPLIRPIFKYGVSFCSGLCLGTLTAAFFSWQNEALPLSLCVLLWAVVGYFAAEMLLKKSFRVFRAWKGCVAMAAVMGLLCFSFTMDFFGVVDKVPDADQVASVTVYGSMGYPSDDGRFMLKDAADPDVIQRVADLHRAVIQDKDRVNYDSFNFEPGDDYIYFDVTYTLKDGSTLERNYNSIPIYQDELDLEGSVTWQADQLLQDRALVEQCYDFDTYEQGRLVEAYLEGAYDLSTNTLRDTYLDNASSENLTQLWQAVRQDFDEGTIGVRYLFDSDQARQENTYRTDLNFTWEMPNKNPGAKPGDTYLSDLRITLTPNASNTLAWLEEMGALGEDYTLATQELRPAAEAEEYTVPADGPSAEAVEIK